MKKKILIGLGIFAVIGVIFLAFVSYVFVQTVDEKLKEKEPEFKKYLTMSVEEQNAYSEKNMDFLLSTVIKEAQTSEEKDAFEKIKSDPAAKQAGIELGRTILAKMILSSDAIVADLKEDAKSKLTAESEKMSARFEAYSKILEKYNIGKSK